MKTPSRDNHLRVIPHAAPANNTNTRSPSRNSPHHLLWVHFKKFFLMALVLDIIFYPISITINHRGEADERSTSAPSHYGGTAIVMTKMAAEAIPYATTGLKLDALEGRLATWKRSPPVRGPCQLDPQCGATECCGKKRSSYENATKQRLSCPHQHHLMMHDDQVDGRIITVALMYYAQPDLLVNHFNRFLSYPSVLRSRLSLLIVNDGSPPGLQPEDFITQAHKASFYKIRILNILRDKPWNQPQARNLAFHYADTENVLMVDLDLLIPSETFEELLSEATTTNSSSTTSSRPLAHRFNRRFKDGSTRIHPSAAFLSVDGWWKAGGADEDFSGNYGKEDTAFWEHFSKMGGKQLWHRDLYLVQQEKSQHCRSPIIAQGLNRTKHACQIQAQKRIVKNSTVNELVFKNKTETHCWSNSYLRIPWELLE